MKTSTKLNLLSLPITAIGFLLVAWQTSWVIALGVIVMLWGYGVQLEAKRFSERKIERRSGYEIMTDLPGEGEIAGTTVLNGQVVVARASGLYCYNEHEQEWEIIKVAA